jgi:predicted nucleic acid-binding protein
MPNGFTVSNSSCLIGLDAIARLDLLKQLYGTVHVPGAVSMECGVLPSWIQVHPVQNQSLVQLLRIELGAGEAEAIALGAELPVARLILDDKKARRIAKRLNLPVTGTLAILLRAKQAGVVPNVKDLLNALLAAQFWVSDELVKEVLRQAGE